MTLSHFVATIICWIAVIKGLKSGWLWRIPVFLIYLILQAAYWSLWTKGIYQYLILEPLMIGIRFLILVEMFNYLSFWTKVRERRWAAALLAVMAFLLVYKSRELFVGGSYLEAFRSIRKFSGLVLASMALFGYLLYWIKPLGLPKWVRYHMTLITFYFLLKAMIEFMPRSEWWTAQGVFFTGASVCLVLWIYVFRKWPLRMV